MNNYYSLGQIEQDPTLGIRDVYAAPMSRLTAGPTAVLDAGAERRLMTAQMTTAAPGAPTAALPAAGVGKVLPIAIGALVALMLLK